MELDDAVRAIVGAIDSRRNTFTFPWQMSLLKELIVRAPESLLRRLAPRPREQSKL